MIRRSLNELKEIINQKSLIVSDFSNLLILLAGFPIEKNQSTWKP